MFLPRLSLAGPAALVGLLAACGGAPSHADVPRSGSPEAMSAYDAAVRVEPISTCPARSAGGGLTDGRFVLTTASVVAGATRATVTGRSGHQVVARVLTVDPEQDVAWLYAPGLPSRPTDGARASDHVAPAYVFVLEGRTMTVLRASRLERTTSTGTDIYGAHRLDRQVFVLHLDAAPSGGRTPQDVRGAPVLDQDGRLLGIVLGADAQPADMVVLAGDAVAASQATTSLARVVRPETAGAIVTACATAR